MVGMHQSPSKLTLSQNVTTGNITQSVNTNYTTILESKEEDPESMSLVF